MAKRDSRGVVRNGKGVVAGRAVCAAGRLGFSAALLSLAGAGCFFDWTRDPQGTERASPKAIPPGTPDAEGTTETGDASGPLPSPTKDAGEALGCDAVKRCPAEQYCELLQGCAGAGTCVSARACVAAKVSCGCDGRFVDDCSTQAAGGSIDGTGMACAPKSCTTCDTTTQQCEPLGSSSPTWCVCKTSAGTTRIACK